MKLNFPADCTTEASRLSYALRLKELFRLDHNIKGAPFKSEADALRVLLGLGEKYSFDFIDLNWTYVLNGGTHEGHVFPGIPHEQWGQAKDLRDLAMAQRVTFTSYIDNIYKPKLKKIVDPSLHALMMQAQYLPHWEPTIVDNIDQNGNIVYPAELDTTNEGSKFSFILVLIKELNFYGYKENTPEFEAVNEEYVKVKQEAFNGTYWSPSLEDVR